MQPLAPYVNKDVCIPCSLKPKELGYEEADPEFLNTIGLRPRREGVAGPISCKFVIVMEWGGPTSRATTRSLAARAKNHIPIRKCANEHFGTQNVSKESDSALIFSGKGANSDAANLIGI